jgi:Asp-tRNA(Asn)/Glu-tRNA(Gln) amidotransferase A subunit family amidase
MLTRLPSIADALVQMHRGDLNAGDIEEYCRATIRQFDPRIHAWERVAERNEVPFNGGTNALAGVTVGVKDVIDVAGWPTRAASPLRAEHIATVDAPIVKLLRQHGATILGKTETCQFACFDPAPTRNPWNLQRSPGGSSAGSAAAVACEQCQLAIGTQTGGSIIRPASYCGISGFKPAFDAQWQAGVVPVSPHLDHVGLFARRMSDLQLVWSLLRGRRAAPDVTQAPVIGVLREYFDEHASPEVARTTNLAIEKLRAAGAPVSDVPLPPGWSDTFRVHRILMAADVARYHVEALAAHPEAFLPNLTALLHEGLKVCERDYDAALEYQRAFCLHLVIEYPKLDVLVCPATISTAPAPDTTGDARFNVPWSLAGVPVATVPCGLASDGLPCGLQIIKPHGCGLEYELELLQIAAWCEKVLDLDLRPPLLNEFEGE